ncbi:LLM class flavin-dependent oxidoreductase, partial [Amycolatopsis acidicola]
VVIGVGRGDACLAQLGLAPAPLGPFDRFLDHLAKYLTGVSVPLGELAADGYRPVSDMGVAEVPEGSTLQRLDDSVPVVPVDVAATGPKVIGIGARRSRHVSFTVGADEERIRKAIETARAARETAGLNPDELSFGAYVNVVCHDDIEVARRVAASGVSIFSRFSAMYGKAQAGVGAAAAASLEKLSAAYDVRHHGELDAGHNGAVDLDFMNRFAIVGSPGYCAERLARLEKLGLDRVVVMSGLDDGSAETARQVRECREALDNGVLPLPARHEVAR